MAKEANTKELLNEVLTRLTESNIVCWVFGGWAEELRQSSEPRGHNDIDLLYPAKDFRLVDKYIKANKQFVEIKAKHFVHKRAFLVEDVVVELLLVQPESGQHITNFHGTKLYTWPKSALDKKKIDGLFVASAEALLDYRVNYENYH